MNFIRIDNQFINLDRVTSIEIQDHPGHPLRLWISLSGDERGEPIILTDDAAGALLEWMDSHSMSVTRTSIPLDCPF